MNKKITNIFANPWVIFLLALAIRVAFLTRESLWLDEVITYGEGIKPIDMIINDRWDPHPPLYYLFLHYWLKLGDGDFWFRLPSSVFGALSVTVMLLLAKRLYEPKVAIYLTLLFVFTPVHIWFSQEARMYALLSLLSLLSTYFFVCLIQGEKRWILYVITTILGLYTQYTMGIVVLGQNLFITAYWLMQKDARRQISLPHWFLSQISLIILYIPWIPQLPAHWDVMRFSDGYPLQPLTTTPLLMAMALGVLVTWVGIMLWFNIDWSPDAKRRILLIAFIGCTVIYIGLCGLYLGNRAVTAKRQSFVLFPLLCMILYSTVPIWKNKTAIAIGFIAISIGFSTINIILIQKPQWRELTMFVQEASDSNDVLIFNPPFLVGPFLHYSDELESSIQNFYAISNGEQATILNQYERVWLITNLKMELWEDTDYVVRSWMQENYQQTEQYDYGELEVITFITDSGQ